MKPFQGVDYYRCDDLLTLEERSVRDTVRRWIDNQYMPKVEEYFEQGKYDDAIMEFSYVLASNPKDHKVRFYLATSYLKRENHEQAVAEYLKIPPDSKLYIDSIENAALVLEDLERANEAIDLIEEAIRAKPKETDLYLLLSSFYERKEDLGKALGVLQDAQQFDEKNTDLLFRMGIVSDKLGNFDEMVRLMREVIRLTPEHADALNYLGYTFADKGIHLDESLELVQKALSLKPDSGYITDSLGWVYYKKGEYEKAVKELERGAGQQFDPIVVDVFIKLIRSGELKVEGHKVREPEPKPKAKPEKQLELKPKNLIVSLLMIWRIMLKR